MAKPIVQNVWRYVVLTGKAEASERFDAYARVEGYLKTAEFTESGLVKKGQVLFTIEKEPYEAALAEAKAKHKQSIAARNLAESTFRRIEELFAKKAVTKQELQTHKAKWDVAEAEIEADLARIDKAAPKTDSRSPR